MKLLQNKLVESVILLPIVFIFFTSIYYLFTSYVKYNSINKSLVYSEYILNLDELLNQQGESQGLISIFLGMNGKSDYSKIEQQWKKTDVALETLSDFISKHSEYSTSNQKILNASAAMKDARSKVSVLNIDYNDLYIDNYTSKLNSSILKNMDNIDQSLPKEITDLLKVIANIAFEKENTILERAYISYILGRAKPFSNAELEVWDSYIGGDSVPNYDLIASESLVKELNVLFKSDSYKDTKTKINDERIIILNSINSGEFATSITKWYELQSSKIVLFDKAQVSIEELIKINVNLEIIEEQKMMAISAIVIILSLLIAFVIRNIFSNIAQDTKELGDVLKKIESNLDEKDDSELSGMLERQNKTEIYQFLEKTIYESNESKRFAHEASEAKSKFLANMSHEIRTPLNGIVGFTELLKTTNLDNEQEEFLEVIEKSSENLLAVINDILDLSKIESNKIDIEDVPFSPIEEFESGIESYGAKASEKSINLGFYIDPRLSGKIRGDAIRIKQVIVNLISNAVKFTPEGGEIDVLIERIATKDNNITVRFSVKDSGIGITAEQQTKIFEAFSQADSSTNRKFGGTGLGLTISKTLIELMGGTLELVSKVDEGATFFFSLTFEEAELFEQMEVFNNIDVGYYLPKGRDVKIADEYAEEYIRVLNNGYRIFEDMESILSLNMGQKPEIIFVDYDYINNVDLKKLNSLDVKIALFTSVHKKAKITSLDFEPYRVLYAPINFSKITKVLKSFSKTLDDYQPQSDNIAGESINNSNRNLASVDILLCKHIEMQRNIFKVMVEKLGYSVDMAVNANQAEKMIHHKNYKYVLVDKDFDGLSESDLAIELKNLNIPTILFVENIQAVGYSDRQNFTEIKLDVANIQLLNRVIKKLPTKSN